MRSRAGTLISEYRQRHGLTLEQFGAHFKVAKQTVLGWEKRGKTPTLAIVVAIERMGICTADDWLRSDHGDASGPLDRAA